MARAAFNDHEQRILDNIDEHGWYCMSVFDPKNENPTFSYSVGFTRTLKQPEFIVFGLPHKLMHSMLWEVFRQIRDGAAPHEGMRWQGILEGFDCVSRKVHPSNIVRERFNSAMWLWDQGDEVVAMEAYQLVWPGSKDGLFPWDAGCSDIVKEEQPPLYLPNRSLQ